MSPADRRRSRLPLAVVAVAAAAALAVAGGWLFASRGVLVELWTIRGLDAADEEVRAAAVEKLGQIGTERSIAALWMKLARPADPAAIPGETVSAALVKIFGRVGTAGKVQVFRALLDGIRAGAIDIDGQGLPALAPQADPAFDVLVQAAKSPVQRERVAAALVLEAAWPRSAEAVRRLLVEGSAEALVGLLEAHEEAGADGEKNFPEIAARAAGEHPDPRVRAIGLTLAIGNSADGGLRLLRDAYAKDPDPAVRRAALRIAGALGSRAGNLDLRDIVLRERDPAILAAALAAREGWASAEGPGCLELEGVECLWLPDREGALEWTAGEVARLEEILGSERDPDLRDAASRALALRRGRLAEARADPTADREPGLEVHEAGVWQEGGAGPEDEPSCLATQVVFVRAVRPLALHLRVDFGSGFPRSSCPAAPDGGESALEWTGLRAGYGRALEGAIPAVDPASWWGAFGRVPASTVAFGGQRERFLTYGGEVERPPIAAARWSDSSRTVLAFRLRAFGEYPDPPAETPDLYGRDRPDDAPMPGVLVVRKEPGRPARGRFLGPLESQAEVEVPIGSLDLEGRALRDRLKLALEAQGLRGDEALAVLRAWKREFFENDGLRILAVLPGWLPDGALPLRVRPAPADLARAAVFWKECGDLPVGRPGDRAAAAWPQRPFELERGGLAVGRETLALWKPVPLRRRSDGRISRFEALCISGDGKKALLWRKEEDHVGLLHGDLEARTAVQIALLGPDETLDPAGCSLSDDGRRAAWVQKGTLDRARIADLEARVVYDLFETSSGWSLAISGDGRRAAVSLGRGTFVIDLDPIAVRKMKGLGDVASLSISPDGRRVAVLTAKGIDVLDLERSTATSVPAAEHRVMRLLSGGRSIFFASSIDRGETEWIADVEARSLARACRSDPGGPGPWLVDGGRRVLFFRGGALRSRDLATGAERALWSSDVLEPERGSVSADGTRMVLAAKNRYQRRTVTRILDLPR